MPRRRRAAHSGIDEIYWDRLDNAAKIVPAVTSARNPNVFRLTAVLTEPVDPAILQAALEKALSIMPSFSLGLHKGLFWYYFDKNDQKPKVRPERGYPCAPIYKARENGFLFRVLYHEKRINFEIYHALSDGMGAMNFLKLLVYCYFNIKLGDNVPEEYIRREMAQSTRDFDEDSFNRSFDEPSSCEMQKSKTRQTDAYHLSAYRFDGDRLGALCAAIETDRLVALAKEHGVTLTQYICALLVWSIYNTSYRRLGRAKPIVVSVPVNLRSMFDSTTQKNFFGHMFISVTPSRTDDFESVLKATKESFDKSLRRECFERQIADHVAIERIPGVKFVPVQIKNMIMRHSFKKASKSYTITLSNLGKIELPPMISDQVDRFEMLIGASASHPKKLSLCSFGNKTCISFSSTTDDNSIEQFMLSFLADRGVDITVSSNETPAPIKQKKKKKEEQKNEVLPPLQGETHE